MRAATAYFLVLITTGSEEEALALSRAVVSRRLAACVNVLPKVRSIYWWNDQLQDDQEFLLLCKTKAEHLPRLEEAIKKLHSYDVPEIISLKIESGSEEYLRWLDETVIGSTKNS